MDLLDLLFPAVDQLGVVAGVESLFRRGFALVFVLDPQANPEAIAVANWNLNAAVVDCTVVSQVI